MQPGVNAPDHEDVVLRFLDFADRLAREAVAVGGETRASIPRTFWSQRHRGGMLADAVQYI
jgi:hypothetical protein